MAPRAMAPSQSQAKEVLKKIDVKQRSVESKTAPDVKASLYRLASSDGVESSFQNLELLHELSIVGVAAEAIDAEITDLFRRLAAAPGGS